MFIKLRMVSNKQKSIERSGDCSYHSCSQIPRQILDLINIQDVSIDRIATYMSQSRGYISFAEDEDELGSRTWNTAGLKGILPHCLKTAISVK